MEGEDDKEQSHNSKKGRIQHPYYIDTNVLLSQFKRTDPFFRESKIIVEGLKKKSVNGCTSSLTILEIVSFTSRNFSFKKGETSEESRNIAIAKILSEIIAYRLRFTSPQGDYILNLDHGDEEEISMPSIFGGALSLAATGLKTLDLIHLGAAKYTKEVVPDLAGFVTGDNDFLSQGDSLSSKIGIPILSPGEFVKVLKL
jgi:predicted nucleic acid-binding protein